VLSKVRGKYMSNQEKLEYLRQYKEVLIYATGYEKKEEKEVKEKQEPQKVLVLKRKWYGEDKKVA